MKANEENLITSFIEKPKKELLPEWVSDTGSDMQYQGRNYLASMGIYIFNRKLLFDLLEKIKKMLLILEKRSFHLQLVNIK